MKKVLSTVLISAFFCGFAQESKDLATLKKQTQAIVTISKSTANPNFIRFSKPEKLALRGGAPQQKAGDFLKDYYAVFNLKSADEMVFTREDKDRNGLTSLTYKQYYKGVPVYDGLLKFHFNASGFLTAVNGNSISNIKVDPTPDLSAEEASHKAIEMVKRQELSASTVPLEAMKTTLLIFPKGLAQGHAVTSYLVYEVEVSNRNDVREWMYIDAHTGALVEQFTGIHNVIDRKLYETNTSPSNLKWKEGDPLPGTLNIWQRNEVITSEHVYNFFNNAFGHVSYDNADHTMTTINNNPNIDCPNANWNGFTANYCNGTASDDVVAHEWGHAYTEYTSGLIYQYQAGALNESYSDVWGETIDILNNYQDEGENLNVRVTTGCSGSQRWKMGEDATAFGGAIRDMWNPNCNSDPGSVLDSDYYYCSSLDNGGVHTNSGVPNHLYALLVDGGTYNGYTMTGIGFVKAAHLWWRAQSAYLTATSDFVSFADALEASLTDLIGLNLQGLSTTATAAGLSGQSFTASDLQNLQNGIAAVQLRESPADQCGFLPLLSPTPNLCPVATEAPLFKETWENGLGNWTVTNIPSNPNTWEARDWGIVGSLPKGRAGKAIFGPDPINGDCEESLQNGILRIESPTITFPNFTAGKYEMAFNHYVATEAQYDGGNVKFSLNGGAWTVVPYQAFTQNFYNTALVNSGNDNPLKGQLAFSGTDGGSLSGSWGQSVIDLSVLGVTSGSTIKFRFEMGTDGCNGNDGWYIDEIYVYNCAGSLAVQNTAAQNAVQVYPNPTSGLITIQNAKKRNLKKAELYSVSGQLLKSFKLEAASENITIDISSFSKGNYLLKIVSDTETTSVKVLKK